MPYPLVRIFPSDTTTVQRVAAPGMPILKLLVPHCKSMHLPLSPRQIAALCNFHLRVSYGRSSITTSLTNQKTSLALNFNSLKPSPKLSFLLTGVLTIVRLYHRLVTFTMTTPSSGIPGLVVPEGNITAEAIPNVDNIGGKPHESHDIEGVPITPEIAAQIRSAEVKAGHDTGKGSAAARVQSAAAFNLRENIVPQEK